MHEPRSERDVARDVIAARLLDGVGDVGVDRELRAQGTVRGLLRRRGANEQTAAYQAADEAISDAHAIGAQVLVQSDGAYPARLSDLYDAPAVLFARGALATAEAPAVAIVGTRRATSYGLRMARAIATACARSGVAVISGLAQGIDGAAHEAALTAGGRTVAVLGTGLNVAYPRRHHALQSRIAEEGLLLSELVPRATGHGGTFPRRNRMIAALADLTVVVEAGIGSGALITADYAHALDRRIACVPNAIDVPTAFGSNALLKAFAEPILEPDDVLHLLSLQAQPTPRPVLDGDAASCWDAILDGADSLSTIRDRTTLSMRNAAGALTALELEGLVHVDVTGRIRPNVNALAC